MRTRIIMLAAAAAVGVTHAAFGIEENRIRSAVESQVCPLPKIDTTGMPDFSVCKQITDIWIADKCQEHQWRPVAFNQNSRVLRLLQYRSC
jgi:hypothetical protein